MQDKKTPPDTSKVNLGKDIAVRVALSHMWSMGLCSGIVTGCAKQLLGIEMDITPEQAANKKDLYLCADDWINSSIPFSSGFVSLSGSSLLQTFSAVMFPVALVVDASGLVSGGKHFAGLRAGFNRGQLVSVPRNYGQNNGPDL